MSAAYPLRVYVAGPYARAVDVRGVHGWLRARGHEPSSTWAEHAEGSENLAALSIGDVRAIAAKNDLDVATSDVVVVLGDASGGRETYCEAARAILAEIPVVWVDPRPPLSAYRVGVHRCHTVAGAMDLIDALALVLRRRRAADALASSTTTTDTPEL